MRILIVEDDHEIADSIKKGLEQALYVVDVAYDGITGYDFASSEEYDAIILDLLLPGTSGMEICNRLRKSDIHTPILILTSRGQIEDKIEGFETGADDYLVKPFAFAELLARVKALIRRPTDVLPIVLKVDGLTLVTATHEVKRENSVIQLTQTEFRLLEYLMTHAKRAVSKQELISHVWNYDADILPNTVETYIGYLRNKIDKPFDKPPLIHTIKGLGYKIGN